jgi:hypothetical protein
LFQYFLCADAHVAFIENAFAVFDEQYLRAFVPHLENFGYLVGKGAMGNEIQKVTIDGLVQGMTLQPVQYHATDAASGAVLKDQLRLASRLFFDLL